MTDREILKIALDDSEFKEFKAKFDTYQAEVKKLPESWRAASDEIGHASEKSHEIVKALEEQSGQATTVIEQQTKFADFFAASELTFAGLVTSGKHFASNIRSSTQSLLKWTRLTTIFSGIIGAGGLFGIDRMAANVASQRTSAMGLGVSYGERASFLTNFGRLGNPEGILSGFSHGLADPSGRAGIRRLLGHEPTGDAAASAAEALPKFKEFVDSTPPEILGSMLERLGYTKLGLGLEQARMVRGMSRDEVSGLSKSYSNRGGLDLDDKIAKKWTDFTTQIGRASCRERV